MSNPPPFDRDVPTLTPEVAADEELLAEAVDTFIATNRLAKERAQHIADHQEMLRQEVDGETWKLALQVDEMIVERWADVAVELARWAFNAGRSFPLAREGSS